MVTGTPSGRSIGDSSWNSQCWNTGPGGDLLAERRTIQRMGAGHTRAAARMTSDLCTFAPRLRRLQSTQRPPPSARRRMESHRHVGRAVTNCVGRTDVWKRLPEAATRGEAVAAVVFEMTGFENGLYPMVASRLPHDRIPLPLEDVFHDPRGGTAHCAAVPGEIRRVHAILAERLSDVGELRSRGQAEPHVPVLDSTDVPGKALAVERRAPDHDR